MPSRDSSVGRASAWSHTVSGSMIAPGFESHQCLAGMWKRWLGCHAGCQEVSRCSTRGESQGMCDITYTPLLSSNKAEPTLALKPRGDVTRSPKQGHQWPHKKDSCPPKIFKKKQKTERIKIVHVISTDYVDAKYFSWMLLLAFPFMVHYLSILTYFKSLAFFGEFPILGEHLNFTYHSISILVFKYPYILRSHYNKIITILWSKTKAVSSSKVQLY